MLSSGVLPFIILPCLLLASAAALWSQVYTLIFVVVWVPGLVNAIVRPRYQCKAKKEGGGGVPVIVVVDHNAKPPRSRFPALSPFSPFSLSPPQSPLRLVFCLRRLEVLPAVYRPGGLQPGAGFLQLHRLRIHPILPRRIAGRGPGGFVCWPMAICGVIF